MDKTFSDDTLRKALSLNLIELPDGIDNVNELNNRMRIVLTAELIQHLQEVQKTQALNNTIKIDNVQRSYTKPLIVMAILWNIILLLGILSLYSIIDIKFGISLLILMLVQVAIDLLVMFRISFKIVRIQVAQATPMVDELYQRQFNYNI